MDHHKGYHFSDCEEVCENESKESEQEVWEVESTLIAKPKTKLAVQNFFHVESDSNGCPSNTNKPICYNCMEPVTASYGNTSTLFTIIYTVNIHWYMPKFMTKRNARRSCHLWKVAVCWACFQFEPEIWLKGKKWQQLTNKVTRCIAKDILSICIVDKPGFKQILDSFDPRYQLPSRKHFSKTAIPALFNTTQLALASMLQEVKYFSSTTDLWSSVCTQPYLSYTVHYITKTGNYRIKVCKCCLCPRTMIVKTWLNL